MLSPIDALVPELLVFYWLWKGKKEKQMETITLIEEHNYFGSLHKIYGTLEVSQRNILGATALPLIWLLVINKILMSFQ